MDLFRELREELRGYDYESDPKGKQSKKILNAINVSLERNGAELQGSKPPLELLVYTMKKILYPNLLPESLSDLLQIVTMIEFYRLQLTERAIFLLEWDSYFKDQSGTLSLTEYEQKVCQRLVSYQAELRQIFLNNVIACCVLDLKVLWLANSNTAFWLRWNEYFSIFTGNDHKKNTHIFHHHITEDEVAYLRESVSEISNFMETTVRTAVEQADRGQSIQTMFQSKSFREQFASPTLAPDKIESLEYHLQAVQEAAKTIEAIEKH